MFYTFSQNNSGGFFRGPHYVIVEADSADEANERAQDAGVYFNGVIKGRDCGCCGDRWYPASEWNASEEPEVYGEPASATRDCTILFK